jgi:hypothetical protein
MNFEASVPMRPSPFLLLAFFLLMPFVLPVFCVVSVEGFALVNLFSFFLFWVI